MQNDYNNEPGKTTVDKAGGFARSASQQLEQKSKDVADDAQKMLKEGKEEISKVMETLDKKVRENPWPIIAGVVVGSFLLGCLVGKSK